MFDWEQGIALHQMQRIRALSLAEGDVSWDFSSCSRNLGYILELQWDGHSTLFSEVRSPVLLGQTPRESNLGLAG